MESFEETAPLLVDPPIDDESYRREARTFPSDEQKHLLFASYTLTTSISRFFEIISTLLIALSFTSNLLPVTACSFFVLASSSPSQQVALSIARMFKSRVRLLSLSIVVQRLAMLAFATLILNLGSSARWTVKLFILCGLTASIIALKSSLFLYQMTFRRDWLYILANGKDSVRLQFETSAHTVSIILQLVCPIATGLLVSSVWIQGSSKILAYVAVLGIFTETSLAWKLCSTCYALYLPRSSVSLETFDNFTQPLIGQVQSHPMIGVLTTPVDTALPNRASSRTTYSRSLPRIYNYIKRKPIPVIVTVGVVLINVSLITMGPHIVWFLLRCQMNPAVVGFFKFLQTLITLHPSMSPLAAFNVVTLGALATVLCLAALLWGLPFLHGAWPYLFALCVVVTRSAVPTINLVGDQFVEDYLANEEVHKVYKENVLWLRSQCELLVHLLPFIFSSVDQFIYPISISAGLVFIGRFLILRTIRKYWRPDYVVP